MSTVPETIAAAQCGLEVLGLSCITNMAAGSRPDSVVSDEEVTATAGQVADHFCALVKGIVSAL